MKKLNRLFTNIKLKYKNWSGTPPLLILALTITMGFVAIAILQGGGPQSDFDTMKQATLSGNYGQYTWNPYPFYWFFYPFAILPHPIGFALWVLIGAIGLVITTWKLGGSYLGITLSVPFIHCVLAGQLDGLVAWGILLTLNTNPWLASVGVVLISFKPHLGIIVLIYAYLLNRPNWQLFVIPSLVYLASFIWWGWWIPDWLTSIINFQDKNVEWNIVSGIWPWGLLSLPLLWVYKKSLGIWLTVQALCVPYLGPYSLVILFIANPLPWWLNILFWIWSFFTARLYGYWIILALLLIICYLESTKKEQPLPWWARG